jgi:hypothetical protein
MCDIVCKLVLVLNIAEVLPTLLLTLNTTNQEERPYDFLFGLNQELMPDTPLLV